MITNISKLKTLAFLLTTYLNVSKAQQSFVGINTPNAETILTITNIKKPLYAFKRLIVGKMKKSIPQYQSIKGLNKKLYDLTEDNKNFGGIYFWQTEQDAKNWFTTSWFERVKKKYKTNGKVDYYEITEAKSKIDFNKVETRKYWAAVSFQTDSDKMDSAALGLLVVIGIKDKENNNGFLTLWENKQNAKKYFATHSKAMCAYYNTPIQINNTK